MHKTSSAQVWRGTATTTVSTGISVLAWTFSWLWFGFSARLFFLGALALEKGELLWLGNGLDCFQNYCLSRLRCSGVALCLWLGDNIAILSMVK
jgi:hypothetical protein